ncbi:hypothetical protein CHS0354_018447 [Potamilus streckersoni]|uniref:Site-specific DNA-methyltransferase n=1 Tax=Potamilus streckersoni TaxID=2493646 RepID=A0AAE0W9B0_9BIVA|nr:hypothetical protein CHS0354_018447 [Potamilus streckersoni]
MSENQLYYGDNLDVLRTKIPAESVDLCYIDPPFNSKRSYFQIYNALNEEKEDRAQSQAFSDTWYWGEEAVSGYAWITDITRLQGSGAGKLTPQTATLIKGLHEVLGRGALMAYIIHMTLRIAEIHRVLKPTGSFYLHCDPTASHYLKLLCDSIFCADGNGGEFRNEISWERGTASGGKAESYIKQRFKYKDKDGRLYRLQLKNRKQYLDESLGKPVSDNWIDIFPINVMAKERLGYPTQKPEALMRRIISASSNKGDVVLDAYCGCGTTVAVAHRLKRRWIGIDITYQSISLILKRLKDQYRKPSQWENAEAKIKLDGIPRDIASARALAERRDDKTRKEFEKWAVLTYSDNTARINEKKGADKGIDGTVYFLTDKDTNGKAVFQVKSGGAGRATVSALNSDRQREGAEIGYLITMDEPTKPMLEEALAAGKYKHPQFIKPLDRIVIVTVQQILDGDRLTTTLPMPQDAVRSAQRVSEAEDQTDMEDLPDDE